MSGADRDRFEAELSKDSGKNIRARLTSMTVCDEKGNLLFSDSDMVALGDKSSAALHRIFEAALRLNAIGKQDHDSMEKNSEAAI